MVNGAVVPVSSSNATDLPNAKEAETALMAALTAGDQQAVERAEAALKSAARTEKISHAGSVDGIPDVSQVTSLHVSCLGATLSAPTQCMQCSLSLCSHRGV